MIVNFRHTVQFEYDSAYIGLHFTEFDHKSIIYKWVISITFVNHIYKMKHAVAKAEIFTFDN